MDDGKGSVVNGEFLVQAARTCIFCFGSETELGVLIHEEHVNGSGMCRSDMCKKCLHEFLRSDDDTRRAVPRGSWPTASSMLFSCAQCRAPYVGAAKEELCRLVYERRMGQYGAEVLVGLGALLYVFFVDFALCDWVYSFLLRLNSTALSLLLGGNVSVDVIVHAIGVGVCLICGFSAWMMLCRRFFVLESSTKARLLRCVLEGLAGGVLYGPQCIAQKDRRFSLVYVALMLQVVVFFWLRYNLICVVVHHAMDDGGFVFGVISIVAAGIRGFC